MDEPVDGSDGDGVVGEDAVPGAEGLVGGDGEAPGFVSPGDEFEEDGALGLILLGIGDVVEDDQVELIELRERGLERKIAAGGLELLHDVGGAGVEHTPASLDEGMADSAEEMGLAGAGIADSDEVGAGLDPVTGGECLDPGPRQAGQGLDGGAGSDGVFHDTREVVAGEVGKAKYSELGI